jgi:hypothetical protein
LGANQRCYSLVILFASDYWRSGYWDQLQDSCAHIGLCLAETLHGFVIETVPTVDNFETAMHPISLIGQRLCLRFLLERLG